MTAFLRNHLFGLLLVCLLGATLPAQEWNLFGEPAVSSAAGDDLPTTRTAWRLFCPPPTEAALATWNLFIEPTPAGDFLAESKSPCILLFSASWCRPFCVTAREEHAPWLRASGWIVEEIDVDEQPELAEAFEVWPHEPDENKGVPTWVIVRHHQEYGRHVGADRSGLLQELQRAIARE